MWQRLRDGLEQRLRSAAWRPQVEAARVIARCEEHLHRRFPKELQEHVRPTQWRDGVLTIEADHPAVAQAVYQRQDEMKTALQPLVTVRRVQVLVRQRY